MAINTNPYFYQMLPLQQTIWDKDGTGPLAAGIVTFYSDPAFTVLKDVYQESGAPNDYTYVNIGSTLMLSSIGSFVDESGNNFIPILYPWDTPDGQEGAPGDFEPYYITVVSAQGVLQFTVEDYPENSYSISPSSGSEGTITQNLIINPQFSEVLFAPNPATNNVIFTVSGPTTTVIAPGWSIVSTGSGTITVSQLSLNSQTPGDAAYGIDIAFSADVQGSLTQVITNSPRLLQGGFAAGYFEFAVVANPPLTLGMTYTPSNTGSPQAICSGQAIAVGPFYAIQGTVAISTNNNSNASGNVTIGLIIPVGAHVQVTNVQLLGVADGSVEINHFIQMSTAIQNSQLFSYWQPALNYKPIPSYLVGWDFPLNPNQELGPIVSAASTGTGGSRYVADQTIAYQDVNSSLSFVFDTPSGIGVSTANTTQWALVQYIPLPNARELMQENLSVQLSGYLHSSNASDTIVSTVNLYYSTDASVPVITSGTNKSLIATMTNGIPSTFNGSWTAIPNIYQTNNYVFSTDTVSGQQTININGWRPPSGISNKYVAIVISFSQMTSSQQFALEYCSLNAGDIPTKPAPQTADEVLRECQYYYEKSYDNSVLPGTSNLDNPAAANSLILTAVGVTTTVESIDHQYNTVKRIVPVLHLYSVLGTIDYVSTQTVTTGGYATPLDTSISYWNLLNQGQKGFNLYPVPSTSNFNIYPAGPMGSITSHAVIYHYTADARLGVV